LAFLRLLKLPAGAAEKPREYSARQRPLLESLSSAASKPADSVRRERSIQLNQAAEPVFQAKSPFSPAATLSVSAIHRTAEYSLLPASTPHATAEELPSTPSASLSR